MWSNISILIQAPIFNVQLLLNGLMVGAIFALAAYGLALVWGVMNVKNLAQGEFVIMGGYIAYYLSVDDIVWIGIPGTGITFIEFLKPAIHPLWAIPVAIPVMFGFGWFIYRVIISKVIDRDLFTSLLATFGLAIVLQQALNLVFGPEVVTAESGMANRLIFGEVAIQDVRVLSLIVACLLAVAVVLFMRNSRMGQAIRATAQDARAAKVMGIDTDRVYAFTYSLNAAICGAAGVLISMIWVIQPFYGITHSIRAFVIVVAAGLGNLPGVIISGLGLGVAEQYGGFVLGTDFQQVTVTGLLVIVLIIQQIRMARHRQVVQ
jgi:branched-chain amino acid transport system permease protein